MPSMINNIINMINIVNREDDESCVQVKTQQGVPSQPSNLEAAEVQNPALNIPVISPHPYPHPNLDSCPCNSNLHLYFDPS